MNKTMLRKWINRIFTTRRPLQVRRNRPWLEQLEDRVTPATFYVDNTPGGDMSPDGGVFTPNGGIQLVVPGLTRDSDLFTTISAAVTAANSGDTINVADGTYAENVVIDKAVILLGSQTGQDANTRFAAFVVGADGAKADPMIETVITTPINSPSGANPNANDLVRVLVDSITVDGFVLDGNNPTLDAGGDLVAPNGVHIHASRGLQNSDVAGSIAPVNNLLVANNIIQNFAQPAVTLSSNSGGPALTGNLITGNVIRNFGAATSAGGIGIFLFNNAYADIANNTIVDTVGGGSGVGLQMFNFSQDGSMTWSDNDITVGQSGFGIIAYNFTAPNGVLNINNNTVNAGVGVTSAGGRTYGIFVPQVQASSTVSLTDNIVGNAGGQFARGIDLWNLSTTNTVTVSGGSVGHADVGIQVDAANLFFGVGASTTVAIDDVVINATITGVLVQDLVADAFTTTANLSQLTINGTAGSLGVTVNGAQAAATITQSTIQGHLRGINVLTGAATIDGNDIFNNVVGVRFATGATGSVTANDFEGGVNPDNGTDLLLLSTAGAVTPITTNSFAGDTFYIDQQATNDIDAMSNTFDVADNFRIEDLMHHRLDTDLAVTVGLVTWVTGNVYVTDAGTDHSIQRGIDSASAGNTVNVEAGTYVEALTVNKSLALLGPNVGVAGYSPSRVAEAIIVSPAAGAALITVTAASVTIDGFTVDGADLATRGILFNFVDNGVVQNNIITHATRAVQFTGNQSIANVGGAVTSNLITTLTTGPVSFGVLAFFSSYAQVTDNVMLGVDVGMLEQFFYLPNGVLNAESVVAGNTITAAFLGYGANERGLGAATTALSNNDITITGNGIGVQMLSIFKTNGVTLSGDTITDAPIGVYAFISGGSASLSNVAINTTVGSFIGIHMTNYYSGGAAAATGNGALSLTGVSLSGYPVGILVDDDPLGAFQVSVALGADNAISAPNAGVGLKVTGADASIGGTLSNTAFTQTESGDYIVFASGAQDGTTIDGTSATFNGKTGATATLAENFAIEDHITHEIDDASLGFIRVKAGSVFVTANSGSIQRGVDAASSGDTVNVAAGIYVENVNINKPLTLNGSQAGVDARGRVATESTIQSPDGGVAIALAANGITVDGFHVVNGVLQANGNDLSIVNNRFDVDGGVLNAALVGAQASVIGLGDIGGTVIVSQNSISISGAVGGDGFALAPLDGQHGWSGGAQPNFTNNDLAFDNGDGTFGDESVTDAQSLSGGQSWRYSRGYGSPGQGTPFSPNLGATVGAPSFADGDTATVGFAFRAVNPAGDSSSQSIYEGNVAGTERTGAQIGLQNLETGVRLFTNTYDPATDLFTVVELGVYSGTAWHTVEMTTVYNDNPALDLTTFTVDGNPVGTTNPWMHIFRQDTGIPYVPGSRLKFSSAHADNNAAFKGFYYDDLSMTISDSTNPGVPLASYSTGFENLPADLDGVKLAGNAGALTTLDIANNFVDGGNADSAGSSGVRIAATTPGGNVTISGNELTGFGAGVVVASGNTAAITGGDTSFIHGNGIGIDVDGGSASVTANTITANGTGIRVKNGGVLTTVANNFITNQTGDGIDIEATAGEIGAIFNNDLSGNTGFGVNNLTTTLINAEYNWWGSNTQPGVQAEVNGPVDFDPWLASGADTQPATTGFQGNLDFVTTGAAGAEVSTLTGTTDPDTLILTATGTNTGTYSLNGGPPVAFSGITSFTFNGLGGNDLFRVINPAGGLFAPFNGIFYNGGGQTDAPGDSLEILGGTATSVIFTYTPAGVDGNNGSVVLVNEAITATYTYTGLEPILLDVDPSLADVVFNLPTGDGNNQAILEDDGGPDDTDATNDAGASAFRSGNGTFEYTQFTNPTTSLTINFGDDGESVTVSQLDAAFAPAMPIDLNGGAGPDQLIVDFASGNNVIPAMGINFDGADDLDGIDLLPGYDATTISYALAMDAQSGNINVDGGLVTFTGLDSSIGIFDQLTAANRVFVFDSNDNIVTLDTGFAANDGFSRITSSPDTSLLVDFRNPTTTATVNLGNGDDTLNVPGFDAVGAPPTANYNGEDGDDTFNITASTVTAGNVDGAETGEITGDVLNYDAAGGVITRTPMTGENGTIIAPGFQPFTFANIETVNIVNGVPTISIDDVILAEGNGPGTTAFSFTVRLSAKSTQTIVVTYTTQDGTATVTDADYVLNAGTVTFTPGQTTQTITVLVNGDTKFEPTENFFVTLTAASGGHTFSDAQGEGTILNDDVAPTANIGDVTLAEGNAGTTAFVFTVTLTNASSQTITMSFNTEDDQATVADGDYQANAGVITFAPGTTTQTITVLVNGDTKLEGDEDFIVRISNPTNATINDDVGFGLILNDDTEPVANIDDVSHNEGDGGATAYVFTVTLTNASFQTITIAFATENNSATVADNDYLPTAGVLTFAPGVTTQTITVLVNGDTTLEPDESFIVRLSAPTNATINDDVGFGTILNDDAQPVANIGDVTLAEGNAGTTAFVFTVTLTNASSQTITMSFNTEDDQATVADNDYQPTAGVLTFAPGTTTQTVTVQVNGDTKFESDEAFIVRISNPTNATINDDVGSGVILNDDVQPTISINDVTLAEGDAGTTAFTFTVTLSNGSATPITVDFTTQDGSATVADLDYAASAGTLTFLNGDTTETITVLVNGDTKFESNEQFLVLLSNATGGATFTDANAIGAILNDDAAPDITITDATVTEGDAGTTDAVFTVTLSNPSSQTVTVNFTTVDGTATAADGDYVTTAGTLTFAPGQTTMTITVPVNGDLKFEADESFTVVLSAPTGGATLGDDTGDGAILNDDAVPTLTVDDATASEGDDVVFTFTLSNPTDQDVVVSYNTTSGTATGDVDYNQQTAPATVTILAGQTTATVTIPTFEDNIDESDETFFINIISATNGLVADAQGIGTIIDNDAAPDITITDATVTEGDAGTTDAVFTVTLSNPSSQTVTVDFTTVDGTATAADGDYVTTAGTLTFAPGETTMTITVPVNGDLKFEADESFTVVLSAPTGGATLGDDTGVGAILNDDGQPSVSVDDASAAEGSPVVFTFTLSNPSDQTVTVRVNTTAATATANVDYNNIDSFFDVFFAPGTTMQTVSIPTFEDNIDEPDETFVINILATTNATVADGQGIGTITDNDAAPDITITDATVTEGDAGTTDAVFTVTLSNPSSQTVTVNFTTVDGTATAADGDYVTTAGTLTFAPGQTTMTITVPVNGDLKFEADESFTVVLSAPTGGATLGDDTGDGAILNDDAVPTLTVDDATASEGDDVVFTFTLSNPTDQDVVVSYNTTSGTATGDVDYNQQTAPATVTILAGQTTATVTIPTFEDNIDEPDETFFINIISATNALVADAQGIGTITDDDDAPAISINNVTLAEGNAGTTAFVFTVSLSNPSSQTVTVQYFTFDGAATVADNDYVPAAGTLTFAPGDTSETITVLVNGDTKFEPDEEFNVRLHTPTNATIADDLGFGVIVNDDAVPTLSVSDGTAAEGDIVTFTVTLSNPSSQDVTFTYNTTSGTATGDVDYNQQNAPANGVILAGQTTATIQIQTTEDTTLEPDESFQLNILSSSVPTTDTVGIGTITNDDTQPTISIDDVSMAEGNAGTTPFVFTVTLSNASFQTVTVNFFTFDGAAMVADGDYVANAGTLTFAPFATTQTITVLVNGDTKFEPNEQFGINLNTATNATIADNTGQGTIVNDDAQPAISINDVSLAEGNAGPTNFVFTVTLSNASSQTVTVQYFTFDGAAMVADLDYVAQTGTLTFAPGVTMQTITIVVNGDTKFEPNEQFGINLNTPVNATIADNTAQGTIVNDDGQPTISINDVTVDEGAGTATFTVTLSNASFQTVTVLASTAPNTATAPADYTATSQTVTFAPGVTTQTFSVPIVDDLLDEADETFFVNLSIPTNAAIADGQGVGTITDNDAAPSLSINDVSVSEGAGTATFTVSLSAPSGQTVTVTASTAPGTATAPADYTATTQVLTFAPGVITQTFTVPIVDDLLDEADETFLVNLSSATNATIADGQGVGTIADNDATPTLSINDVTMAEGNGPGTTTFTFTVTLSSASSLTVTVNYATANGTATVANNDYIAENGTVTFAPATTTQTITIEVVGDLQFEPNETFFVNLTAPNNATIADGQGLGTIVNDDQPPDLTLTKSNNVSGETTVGRPWTWTLHVANIGTGPATFTVGQVIVIDNLPNSGVSYGPVTLANAMGVSGAISTTIVSSNLTATASGGSVTIAAGGSFDLTFTATASVAGTYFNPRPGGMARVDPNSNVVETNEANNNALADSVLVNSGVVITTDPPLAQGTYNKPGYSQQIMATGGTGAKTFTISGGMLPPGLTLNLVTGFITGTPSQVGTFSFIVKATDTRGAFGTKPFSITINPPISFTPNTLPLYTVGTPYNQTITAQGGTGNKTMTFTPVSGTLPAGLTITTGPNTLTISGTPTTTTTFVFDVTATDTLGATFTKRYTLQPRTSTRPPV